MAKTKKKEASTRSVFVQILHEHPHLLERGTNDEALKLFEERTGKKITQRHRQYLANVKSDLKKRGGTGNGAAAAKPRHISTARLEHLEELIDASLTTAREINQNNALQDAIQHLRTARNLVVRQALGH